jgi:hypothetical protein
LIQLHHIARQRQPHTTTLLPSVNSPVNQAIKPRGHCTKRRIKKPQHRHVPMPDDERYIFPSTTAVLDCWTHVLTWLPTSAFLSRTKDQEKDESGSLDAKCQAQRCLSPVQQQQCLVLDNPSSGALLNQLQHMSCATYPLI